MQGVLDEIEELCVENRLSNTRASSFAGTLHFAASHVLGRAHLPLAAVLQQRASTNGPDALGPDVKAALVKLFLTIGVGPPRLVHAFASDQPVYVFTDGACEGDDRRTASVGALLFDPFSGTTKSFLVEVPDQVVKVWTRKGSRQPIAAAELLPVVLARDVWKQHSGKRSVLYFVDNESARRMLSRGLSNSSERSDLLRVSFDQ